LFLAAAFVSLAASAAIPAAPHVLSPPTAVLLVSVDTLRADRLGAYGDRPSVTPRLDEFARGATVFTNAYTAANVTQPSLVSLHTGLYPAQHGVDSNLKPALLPAGIVTLGEIMKAAGYRGGSFIAHPWTNYARYGLDKGFEHWEGVDYHHTPGKGFNISEAEYLRISAAGPVTDRVLAWLPSVKGSPFFAWVHYLDPHDPYTPPPELVPRESHAKWKNPEWDRCIRLYDGEVANVDRHFGRLLAAARAAAPQGRLLVVFTADHGEMLFDHAGFMTHGLYTYESEVRVPLVVSGPGFSPGTKVKTPVSLIDVVPTLAAIVGAPRRPAWPGIDLRETAAGRGNTARSLFSESEYYRGPDFDGDYERRVAVDGGKWYTVIGPDHKLVYYPMTRRPGYRIELYGLEDRVQTSPQPAPLPLAQKLLAELGAHRAGSGANAAGPTAEQLEILRSLGYVK
jgi:arylsulfatase A-like enzyme